MTETDGVADSKMELFAYVSEDERLNRTACHIYEMPPGKAREICLLIGAAFQVRPPHSRHCHTAQIAVAALNRARVHRMRSK